MWMLCTEGLWWLGGSCRAPAEHQLPRAAPKVWSYSATAISCIRATAVTNACTAPDLALGCCPMLCCSGHDQGAASRTSGCGIWTHPLSTLLHGCCQGTSSSTTCMWIARVSDPWHVASWELPYLIHRYMPSSGYLKHGHLTTTVG